MNGEGTYWTNSSEWNENRLPPPVLAPKYCYFSALQILFNGLVRSVVGTSIIALWCFGSKSGDTIYLLPIYSNFTPIYFCCDNNNKDKKNKKLTEVGLQLIFLNHLSKQIHARPIPLRPKWSPSPYLARLNAKISNTMKRSGACYCNPCALR